MLSKERLGHLASIYNLSHEGQYRTLNLLSGGGLISVTGHLLENYSTSPISPKPPVIRELFEKGDRQLQIVSGYGKILSDLCRQVAASQYF